jgi:glycosyltransferase involved in cell wall biosynthesis
MTSAPDPDFRLCQVHLSPDDPSQTFARDHAAMLPCHVSVVHGERHRRGGGGARPLYLDDEPILSPRLPARMLRRARTELWAARGKNVDEAADALAYRIAFRRARCRAVLVEFGHVAVRTMDACRGQRLPLVVHFHGFDVHSRALLTRCGDRYRALFDQAAALIGVSQPMCEALRGLGAPSEKVHRIANGADPERFTGAAPDRSQPVFVTVGRFVEKKAPQLTIAAFACVRRRHPEARLRMIGDGDLLDACKDLARGLGLSDAVTFLGSQPPEVVAEELRAARAFLQHSIVAADGDSEGMPVAVLEASMTALPVVSTRHAGIPEIVVDGETGFLVDEHDVAAMAERMGRLVEDPRLAAALGRAGRRRAEREFTLEQTVDRLWAVIRSAAAPVVSGRGAV